MLQLWVGLHIPNLSSVSYKEARHKHCTVNNASGNPLNFNMKLENFLDWFPIGKLPYLAVQWNPHLLFLGSQVSLI
jgi:hypothetical protein